MKVRSDVCKELNDAICELGANAEKPGALEWAIKESARRDEIEEDPGTKIRRIVDGLVRRDLGPDVVLDEVMRGLLVRKLLAAEPFDLKEWYEVSLELAKQSPCQVVSLMRKVIRKPEDPTE